MQIRQRFKITSSYPNFLLPRPHPTLSSGHLTLIHPAAAGKLTTEPRGRVFRRQFLPISQKPTILERPSRIFVKAQERRAPDELLIPRPFRFFSILFIFYRPLPRQNTYFIFGFSLSKNLVQFSSLSQTHFFVSHFSALYNH